MALLGIVGFLLSGYVARQEATQYAAIERLHLAEAVEAHFGAVQDYLATRENIATVVAALFVPPPLPANHALGNFGREVIGLIPDIQTVGWLPEVAPGSASEAISSLAQSGVANPTLVGNDGKPLDIAKLTRSLYPIVDIAPDRNRFVLGVDAGAFPDRLEAIERAKIRRGLTMTPPIRLVQAPEASALLLYAPVFNDGTFRGVLGFGYKVDQLFANAVSGAKIGQGFDLRVFTESVSEPLAAFSAAGVLLRDGGAARADNPTRLERVAAFGGRSFRFVYGLPRDIGREALMRGLRFGAIGAAISVGAIVLLGFLTNRASALAREVGSRRSAEDRLKVLILELNHRVRNVLSIAQAVVRLSFTSGYSLADVQRTCEGRLQALANAMSLLTASDWTSVKMRQLISDEILPFTDRIAIEGPDIALKPRAAQTFALLLYELATNAVKHGALSAPDGKVQLEWNVGEASDSPFRLIWRESGGPPTAAPTRRGFGELLLRRIAPRDVAGRGTLSYAPDGLVYELEAAPGEVIYSPIGPEKPVPSAT